MHHRLEEVGRIGGVRFIDDSKATNVSSVESALQTYQEPVVLIAGGRDKGLDLDELGRVIARHCHALVSIGEAGPRIADRARQHGLKSLTQAGSMDEAVSLAYSLVPDPGVVLLSPACTSFDMFRNAEHRGDEFSASTQRLMQGSLARAGLPSMDVLYQNSTSIPICPCVPVLLSGCGKRTATHGSGDGRG